MPNPNPQDGSTPFYADKTLYAVVLTFLAPIIEQKFGVQLNTAEIAAFAATVMTFIAGHHWKTTQVLTANIDAAQSKTAALTEAKAGVSSEAAANALASVVK